MVSFSRCYCKQTFARLPLEPDRMCCLLSAIYFRCTLTPSIICSTLIPRAHWAVGLNVCHFGARLCCSAGRTREPYPYLISLNAALIQRRAGYVALSLRWLVRKFSVVASEEVMCGVPFSRLAQHVLKLNRRNTDAFLDLSSLVFLTLLSSRSPHLICFLLACMFCTFVLVPCQYHALLS